MVGAYGRTGGEIALPQKTGSNEERIVVMLLMRREDKVVEHLAARNRAVVPEYGIDDTGTVFKVAVGSDDKLDGSAAIEDAAAVAHDSVDQDYVFPYLGRLALGRIDGDVLQLACTFNIASGADLDIFDDFGSLDDAARTHGAVISAMVVLN